MPDSSAASAAVVAACGDAPGLEKLMLAALSVVPEQRSGLQELTEGVDAALARLEAKQDASE